VYEIQIYTATELHLGCEIAYANGDHAHIWHSYIQPLQGTLLIRTRYNLHSSIIWNNAFPKVTEHELYGKKNSVDNFSSVALMGSTRIRYVLASPISFQQNSFTRNFHSVLCSFFLSRDVDVKIKRSKDVLLHVETFTCHTTVIW